VAIEALKERESLAELSKRFDLHPNMISQWKREFLEKSALIFETKAKAEEDTSQEDLFAKIGRLEVENDFLKKSLKKVGL
jgi:transposase